MKPGLKKRVRSLITGNQQKGKKTQNGLVLLVMVIVIFLAISTYYFSSISIVQIQADKLQQTRIALKIAKKALLSYAMLRSDVTTPSSQPGKYGYLPCPANTNGDGNSVGSCGDTKTSYIGWFPWRSLGMAPVRDGNGDCLLYAVSSTYKFNPEAGMLNEDTNFGMFQVVDESNNIIHGETAQNRVVAIVFSAGTALAGQSRNKKPDTECGEDADNFDAYLDEFEVAPGDIVKNSYVDEVNTDRIDRFVQAASVDNEGVFNDQFIVITRDEIWPKAIAHRTSAFDISDMTGASKVRRLTEALARCLASYANDNDNSSLPFPAALDFAGDDYRNNAAYSDNTLVYVGRYPFKTDASDGILAAPDDVPPGNIDNSDGEAELFKKVFNGPIEPIQPPILPLTTYIWECNSLLIASPAGLYADLRSSTSEDRRLWNNWKDRIIYAVSERYAARATPNDDLDQPRCDDMLVANNKCVAFNGTKYAAIVMYGGERLKDQEIDPGPPPITLTQLREAPIAPEDSIVAGVSEVIDSKLGINNYIEVTNVNGTGSGDGDFTPLNYSNDLFFCLTDTEPVDVIECI